MRPLADSPGKQRILFFLVGVVFAFVCGFIQYKWMDIVPYAAFDQQPGWVKGLQEVVGWLPWIAFLGVLILRFVKGQRVRVVFYFLGTAAPLVLLIGWLFLGNSVANRVPHQKFGAEAWRNQEHVEHDHMPSPRLCMVDHLMSSGQLDGLSSHQVIELLGPPHDKNFPFGATSCDIHYYLGPERGFLGIDSEWLFITFGDDSTVDRYWLYRD